MRTKIFRRSKWKVQGNWSSYSPQRNVLWSPRWDHSGGKLYKKEILLQHPYPEGMIYEDLGCCLWTYCLLVKIAVSDLNLYKYYRRPGSTVNSSYSDRLLDFYKAMEWNRAYVERDYPDDPEMKKRYNTRYVFNSLHVVHAILGSQMYDQVNKIRKVSSLTGRYSNQFTYYKKK